jgi:hypothetical protein
MMSASRWVRQVIVMTIALAVGRSASAADGPPTIVLHMDNHARVSFKILQEAEKHAALIYEAIGVRVVWAHADYVDDAIREALHLRVILLSRDVAEQKFTREQTGANVLGQAFRDAKRAYVFPHRITELAAKHGWNRVTMLGHVLAHETGHLVLPADSHSHVGIMSASVNLKSKTLDRFTPEQGAAIRALLTVPSMPENLSVRLAP